MKDKYLQKKNKIKYRDSITKLIKISSCILIYFFLQPVLIFQQHSHINNQTKSFTFSVELKLQTRYSVLLYKTKWSKFTFDWPINL